MSTLSMNQDDHPAHSIPDPTEQYAGDVLPIGTDPYSKQSPSTLGASDASSVDYALGKKSDPKVLSIGRDSLKGWADRVKGR